MSCEQTPLVQRLAVEDCEALERPIWRKHFRSCQECQEEWKGFAQSLAIFKQLEQERVSHYRTVPGWESFARILAHDTGWSRTVRSTRVRLVAAGAALLMVGGVSAFLMWSGGTPSSQVAVESAKPAPAQEPRRSRPVDAARLNYVSNEVGGGAVPVRPGGGRPRGFIFELSQSNGRTSIVEYSLEANAREPSSRISPRILTPVPYRSRDAFWRPPVSSPMPRQPVRVDYPVHQGPAR
ncbi:MAG: hypothetical protein O7A08_00715 [SAR324 cluster bacterium]|nr:hypothetical protein [SAR324 cluster bacterium]